jgi:hypothetical protein
MRLARQLVCPLAVVGDRLLRVRDEPLGAGTVRERL